jgi:hypothetical protein
MITINITSKGLIDAEPSKRAVALFPMPDEEDLASAVLHARKAHIDALAYLSTNQRWRRLYT